MNSYDLDYTSICELISMFLQMFGISFDAGVCKNLYETNDVSESDRSQ